MSAIRRLGRAWCVAWTAGVGFAVGAQAQEAEPSPESYADATAERLHLAAMDQRERLDTDVLHYTAVVQERIGASLRLPLKDRTVYRSEAAHRVWWNRDSENLIQVLAYREQTPEGVNMDGLDLDRFNVTFDPMADRLFFGMTDRDDDLGEPDSDDFWFEHPLYEEYRDRYRFTVGDTLAIALPDGRQVLAIELQVVPHEADVHRMTGSLWIEPETGSLVRAVYRLSDTFDAFRDIPDLQEEEDDDLRFVPGIFKPWTAEIRMIAVDYSLWELEAWLPRNMRIDMTASAGIIKVPVAVDYAYTIEDVTTTRTLTEGRDDDLPEMHFRTRSEAMAYLNELAFGEDVPYETSVGTDDSGRTRYLVPTDRDFLASNDELPPPVWDEAPGFASDDELEVMFNDLASLPRAPVPQVPSTLRWGLQRPDLARYNRVEALSIGGRWQARPNTFLGPLTVTATGRIGVGDLHPNGSLGFTRETLRRRVTIRGYNELAAIDEGARHLGLGNSAMAAFFGRDDGDYYYRSGGEIVWTPPAAERQGFTFRAYAEHQRPAVNEHSFTLFKFWQDGWDFRPNLMADRGWEYGAKLDVNPWWGTDPLLAQGGFDLMLQGGTGDTDYARASLVGRAIFPLPSQLRVALEVGGGSSWGSPSVQRMWYVGGPRTLRGYDPTIGGGGADYARGRIELARQNSFGAVSIFSDFGWTGDFDSFAWDDGFQSVGIGTSLLDGIIRIDGAYGFVSPRGFRLDFYLDGIL
ncbi:MAG: hypothetical protein AAF389_08805 [Gemmatimonadota bacterium]